MSADSQWVSVGELGAAFEGESNVLPQTEDLAGRQLVMNSGDGRSHTLHFLDKERLTDSTEGGGRKRPYLATRIREGIYFVDFRPAEDEPRSVSVIMDLKAGIFSAVHGRLASRAECQRPLIDRIRAGEELTGVTAEFRHGAIDAPVSPATPRHAPTDDLVNKRIEYTYSPTEQYEHIYLNPHLYTWHCLRGVEQGLADTDRCHYYRIADQLYLFVWREKIVPTLGIVLLDLTALKTTGKILGYEGCDFGQVTNFPVGAQARVLNVTEREV